MTRGSRPWTGSASAGHRLTRSLRDQRHGARVGFVHRGRCLLQGDARPPCPEDIRVNGWERTSAAVTDLQREE